MKKRWISMCLILVMVLAAVSAEPSLRWSWEKSRNLAPYYSYQLDDGLVIKITDKYVDSVYDGKSHTMYVWQSFDNENWSEVQTCVYTPEEAIGKEKDFVSNGKLGLETALMVSPYSFEGIFYIEDFASIYSTYGFGLEASVVKKLGSVRLGGELLFDTYALSSNAVYDRITDFGLGLTSGVAFAKEGLDVYSDIELGAMVEKVATVYLPYAYVGVRTGVGYSMGSLALKAQVAARGIFEPQKALSSSLSLVITPSVGVSYTF